MRKAKGGQTRQRAAVGVAVPHVRNWRLGQLGLATVPESLYIVLSAPHHQIAFVHMMKTLKYEKMGVKLEARARARKGVLFIQLSRLHPSIMNQGQVRKLQVFLQQRWRVRYNVFKYNLLTTL